MRKINLILVFIAFVNNAFSQNLNEIPKTSVIQDNYLKLELSGSQTHFAQATTTVWFQQGSRTIIQQSSVAESNDTLQTLFYINYDAPVGNYDLYAYNEIDGFLVLPETFSVTKFVPEVKIYASFDEKTVYRNETIEVAISGNYTHFYQASNTIAYFKNTAGATIPVNDLYVYYDEYMNGSITTTSVTALGNYDLIVENKIDGNIIGVSQLTISDGIAKPAIEYISPENLIKNEDFYVTITGSRTHFLQATSTVTFKQGSYTVYPTNVYSYNDKELHASINFSNSMPNGNYDVYVKNSIDGTIIKTAGVTVFEGVPEVSYVTPDNLMVDISTTITIYGSQTHFLQASPTTVVLTHETNGSTIVAQSIFIYNDETIQAVVKPGLNATLGMYRVKVYNSSDGVLTTKPNIELLPKANPQINYVSPNEVHTGDYLDLYISGTCTHFSQATNTIWMSNGSTKLTSYSIDVYSDTYAYAYFNIGENVPEGNYSLFVKNSIDNTIVKESCINISKRKPTIYAQNKFLPANESLYVMISGDYTHFEQASNTTVFFRQASGTAIIKPQSTNIWNDTYLNINITPGTTVDAGYYDLVVNNMLDGELVIENNLLVVPEVKKPSITVNFPHYSTLQDTFSYRVIGFNTNFLASSLSKTNIWLENPLAEKIYPLSVSVLNDNELVISFTVAQNTRFGKYDLKISSTKDGLLIDNNALIVGNAKFTVAGPNSVCLGETGVEFVIKHLDGNVKYKYFIDATEPNAPVYNTQTSETTHSFNFSSDFQKTNLKLSYVVDNIKVSEVIPINILPVPTAQFILTFPLCADCLNSKEIAFVNTSINASSFAWDFGDGSVSTEKDVNHIYLKDATYKVTLTASNGNCSDTYQQTISTFTGIENIANNKILIFPNPANQYITIQASENEIETIYIFDLSGKIVKSINNISGNQQINIEGLSNGIYNIKFTVSKGVYNSKLVKQ